MADDLLQTYLDAPSAPQVAPDAMPDIVVTPHGHGAAHANDLLGAYIAADQAAQPQPTPVAASPAPSPTAPSGSDLVWDKDGGHDPQTGKLVVGGKPFTQNVPSSALAVNAGMLNGIPVVGPYLQSGAIKAGAYARQLLNGDPADQTASAVQGDAARSAAAYPKTTMASQLAGGTLALGGLGGTETGATMLGMRGAGLGSRAVAGATSGAAIGGTDAAVRSSGDLDAMKRGALISGLLGGGAPAVGAALGNVAGRLGSAIDYFRPAVQAQDAIANDIATSGANIGDIQSRLAANPRLSPMDANSLMQTRAMGLAGTMEGGSRPIMMDAYNARTAGAGQAVNDAYDAAMGPTPDVHALLTGMQDTARRNAQQGFGAALSSAGPVDVSPTIAAIDQRLYPGGVNNPAQMSNVSFGPAEQQLLRYRDMLTDNAGQVTDANRLHQIQSQMRTDADTLGNSASGQDRLVAAGINPIRQNLITQIDQAAGGAYRPAQRQFADDMSIRDAFDQGMNIFRNRTGPNGIEDRPEYFQQWLNNANPAERQAATQGARVAADNTIRATRFSARKGTDLPDVPANFDKLTALLGPDEAGNLQRTMQDERAIADTNNKLFQNSQTQPRRAAAASVAVRPIAPFSPSALSIPLLAEMGGFHLNPYAYGGAAAFGGARTAASAVGRGLDVARNNAMARMLSASGDDAQAAMAGVAQRASRQPILAPAVSHLAHALINGAGPQLINPFGALPPRTALR